MVQITLIGLGQIGSSIGLALAGKDELVVRTGYDRDAATAAKAQKMSAIDKLARSIPEAVEDADLVILSLPTDQIHDMLTQIAPHLKEEAVVMDTAPVKEKIAIWAKESLPAERYYVGMTPVINPAYLHSHDTGIDAAQPDLFHGGMMVIVIPPGTPPDAVKLAADFTRLLGAANMFADPIEVDSLMAATHILPQLLAAALLNITVGQPGWHERSKVAGRAFAEVTGPLVQMGDAGALGSEALLAGENLVRLTDSVIASLQAFRTDIQNQDSETLTERLERARSGREAWWKARQAADAAEVPGVPAVEMPRPSDHFARLLGFGRRSRTKK